MSPWTVRRAPIDQNILRLKQNHQLERDFSDALWEWREVKSSTEAYDCSLDKEFRADDSRIATCQISRKLGPDSIYKRPSSFALQFCPYRPFSSLIDRLVSSNFGPVNHQDWPF